MLQLTGESLVNQQSDEPHLHLEVTLTALFLMQASTSTGVVSRKWAISVYIYHVRWISDLNAES